MNQVHLCWGEPHTEASSLFPAPRVGGGPFQKELLTDAITTHTDLYRDQRVFCTLFSP